MRETGADTPQTGNNFVGLATEDKPEEFVLTLTTQKPMERVTYFAVAGPPARFVVDIWGDWRNQGPQTVSRPGEPFDRIRSGEHPDRLRIVLNYRSGRQPAHADPVVIKDPLRVVVRIPKKHARP